MIKELTPLEPNLFPDLKDALYNFSTESSTFIGRLSRGSYSKDTKYVIQTMVGKYILRNSKTTEALPRLQRITNLLRYLEAEDFPVATPIRTRDGNHIHINKGGLWTMSEYVEGHCVEYPHILTDGQLAAAGNLLGDYHSLVKHYPDIQKRNISWHVDPQQTTSLLNEVLSVLETKSQYDQIDQLVASMIPNKLQRLEDLQETNAMIATQSKLQTHGDFHGANLIFGPNGDIKALVDWEDSDYFMRVAEVQASICMTCKEDITEHFNVPINFRRAKIFLDAYEKVYPLTTQERTLMPAISQLDSIRLDFLLYNHYILGVKDYDIFIPKDSSHWFWWDNHAKEYEVEVIGL